MISATNPQTVCISFLINAKLRLHRRVVIEQLSALHQNNTISNPDMFLAICYAEVSQPTLRRGEQMRINKEDHPELWEAKRRRFRRAVAEIAARSRQIPLPELRLGEPLVEQVRKPGQTRPRLKLVE